jgi:hypothetical protein
MFTDWVVPTSIPCICAVSFLGLRHSVEVAYEHALEHYDQHLKALKSVRAGLERARISGTRSGKAIGGPRKIFDREAILKLRSEGQSFARIAARTHLSVATISNVIRAAERSPAFTTAAPA